MVKYKAVILGDIWQPGAGKCSLEMEVMAENDKEALDRAYNAGDFSAVDDVQLWTRHTCSHGFSGWVLIRDWEKGEDSDVAYSDTICEPV